MVAGEGTAGGEGALAARPCGSGPALPLVIESGNLPDCSPPCTPKKCRAAGWTWWPPLGGSCTTCERGRPARKGGGDTPLVSRQQGRLDLSASLPLHGAMALMPKLALHSCWQVWRHLGAVRPARPSSGPSPHRRPGPPGAGQVRGWGHGRWAVLPRLEPRMRACTVSIGRSPLCKPYVTAILVRYAAAAPSYLILSVPMPALQAGHHCRRQAGRAEDHRAVPFAIH